MVSDPGVCSSDITQRRVIVGVVSSFRFSNGFLLKIASARPRISISSLSSLCSWPTLQIRWHESSEHVTIYLIFKGVLMLHIINFNIKNQE